MTTSSRFLSHAFLNWFGAMGLSVAICILAGCASPTQLTPEEMQPEAQVLRSGDEIKVSFPGAANFDITQKIRFDGKINLTLGGEVAAAGKTPAELEKEIQTLVGSQLVTKDVRVTVLDASFAVFVTGAVLKPGKILPTHSLTALEAIMEAGGFDSAKANTKEVLVIRQLNDGSTKNYVVNMKELMDGKSNKPFFLRHNDMVIVKEKFVWF